MTPYALAAIISFTVAAPAQRFIAESARRVPVAYEVDVVVVGGSTAAVAAALQAKADGASVFLAAPRPYLGEDMAGPLRLWINPDEKPLTRLGDAMLAKQRRPLPLDKDEALAAFTYQADRPSVGRHKDTKTPSLLHDQQWASAAQQSVQYDGGAKITLDLGKVRKVERAFTMLYHNRDYQVRLITIHASRDGKQWRPVAEIKNTHPPAGNDHVPALVLPAKLDTTARYLRFDFECAKGSGRVLVGEIAVTVKGRRAAPKPAVTLLTPLTVKKSLDAALLKAGVKFLYACQVADVLRDADGNLAGIVMANRAGRQAVVAKVIVDATDRAAVARMAGAKFTPYAAGEQTFTRVVVGGEPRTGEGVAVRKIGEGYTRRSKTYDLYAYTLRIRMKDGSLAERMRAEHLARDLTYHPEQQFASDTLFQVPPDHVEGWSAATGEWPGPERVEMRAFRPKGLNRLLVLNGCADAPRAQAAKLLRPMAFMRVGERVGAAAAAQATALPKRDRVRVAGSAAKAAAAGEVREFLDGLRPGQRLPTIPQPARALPVLGEYDVVVIGGGTAGAPAGIAAARQGAKTLVVEMLHGLGGVGTLGAISSYYWGNRVGFTKEVPGGRSWAIEPRMEWWRRQILDAGGEVWFGCMGSGAVVSGNRVVGAVVATPEGRGVVLANTVIDATGNSDIAAAAGAPCLYTDGSHIALQGTGLPPRELGRNYTNTDFTLVDETSMLDVWRVFVQARLKAQLSFDVGQLIDTRERRRIVGDHVITVLDELNRRTYPDTVVETWSNYDTHGYTIEPCFTLVAPDRKGWRTHVPYRAMLPKSMDGILVIGLGISAHRDAVPVIRMQPDIQNGGYAAGVAAALAAKAGCTVRQIDVKALQRHLVKIGNLPESVLTDQDSYPMASEQIEAAVAAIENDYQGVAVVLANPARSRPLLKQAYAAAEPAHKLAYAHVLAVMGDAAGVEELVRAVEAEKEWDEGWRFKAGGQFGANMSRLDSLIYALGRTRDRRALPALLAKLKLLEPSYAFSHHRTLALALEAIGDPAAAEPLAALLQKPGMRGYSYPDIQTLAKRERHPRSWGDLSARRNALRELILARALFRCGDHDGLGRRVLGEYARDLRGHFARHAQAVLAERRKE